MDQITQTIEDIITKTIQVTLRQDDIPSLPSSLVATDNLAEVIEKLTILHIRTWMLEDAVGETNDLKQIGQLKKKIDICFKQKRPQYIQAINAMLDDALKNGKDIAEESVKSYSGFEE